MCNEIEIKRIYQGDNGVIRWPLLQRDGTALDINDLTLLYVEFIQNGRVKQRYTFLEEYMETDPEVRICTDNEDGNLDISGNNVLEIEYTTELTEALSKQRTYLKVTLEAPSNVLIVNDQNHTEFIREVFQVI